LANQALRLHFDLAACSAWHSLIEQDLDNRQAFDFQSHRFFRT